MRYLFNLGSGDEQKAISAALEDGIDGAVGTILGSFLDYAFRDKHLQVESSDDGRFITVCPPTEDGGEVLRWTVKLKLMDVLFKYVEQPDFYDNEGKTEVLNSLIRMADRIKKRATQNLNGVRHSGRTAGGIKRRAVSDPVEVDAIKDYLLNLLGYTPYCGAKRCELGRPTSFDGKQFKCDCGWQSNFTCKFVDEYKEAQAKLRKNRDEVTERARQLRSETITR